jgi:BTB/POZ domain/C2H2-type zinc finger/Zinc-finger of C2H2 type
MGEFNELFFLKWNNFQKNVSTQFEKLRECDELCDITFACDGQYLGAHKLVLFACSPYFKNLLKKNPCPHPVFYFNEVKFKILKAILAYMYLGEVHLSNEDLKEFIKTAESLQIRGLTSKDSNNHENGANDDGSPEEEDEVQVRTATAAAGSNEEMSTFDEYGRKRHGETNIDLKKFKVQKMEQEQSLDHHPDDCNSSSDSSGQMDQGLATTSLAGNSNKQVEMKIEMLEEYTNQGQPAPPPHQQQQQQQQQQPPPPHPTYCTMDNSSFGAEKPDEKSLVDTANRPSTSNYNPIQQQAPPHQQQHQPIQQAPPQYKIDDEIWLETTLLHNPAADQLNKKRHSGSSPNQQNKSQNCLTPRSCPLCSRVYSNVSNLRQHMRLVHHPTTVQCSICRKTFNSNLYLKRHYSTMHTDEKHWENPGAHLENASPGTPLTQILVCAQVAETQNLKIK